MTDLIRRILREETESKKDAIKSMIKKSGLETAAKVMGGVDSLIKILYDGDILKFGEETNTPLAYMSTDRMNLYIHEALVNELGLKDKSWGSRNEKELGKFAYGSKNGLRYAFNATLAPTRLPRLHNQNYYRVVGTSGDSGFGYSFINKKNILGVRYRQQIFKQIIDKYDLSKYMNVKTFY
jgi:hypothetical protein